MSATKTSFTPKDVMTLREKTDMPMMECKAALIEADGDMAKARKSCEPRPRERWMRAASAPLAKAASASP